MNTGTFLELIDQHGSRPDDWPSALRPAMLDVLRESPEAASGHARLVQLEVELAKLGHVVTPGLQGRILALAGAGSISGADRFFNWLTAAIWRPALLSVAPLAFGAVIGMNLPASDDATLDIAALLLDEVYTSYE